MMSFTETAVKDDSTEQTEPQPQARPIPSQYGHTLASDHLGAQV